MTKTQLKKVIQPLMDYWIPRLGVMDWELSWRIVKFAASSTMGHSVAGECIIPGVYKKVLIKFGTALQGCSRYEIEVVVIHELLHLAIQAIWRAGDTDVEEAIEGTLDSLVIAFYRMRYPKKPYAIYD